MKPAVLEEKIRAVLNAYPGLRLTVRQVFYQLVSKQTIPNTIQSYKRFDRILVRLRKRCLEVDARIVDRTRPRFDMGLAPWHDQPNYVECWCEKDALSSVIKQKTSIYNVSLQITRGYPSLSVIRDGCENVPDGKRFVLLYLGDFDPSGEDIYRHIQSEISLKLPNIVFEKVAVTKEDIARYSLPPMPAKRTDTRCQGFVDKYGDQTVELDALPPDILLEKVSNAILKYLDTNQRVEHKIETFIATKSVNLVDQLLKPIREHLFHLAYDRLQSGLDIPTLNSDVSKALRSGKDPTLTLPPDLKEQVAAELDQFLQPLKEDLQHGD